MWKLTLSYGILSQYFQTNLFWRFFEFRVLFLHMIFILFPIGFLMCSSILSFLYIYIYIYISLVVCSMSCSPQFLCFSLHIFHWFTPMLGQMFLMCCSNWFQYEPPMFFIIVPHFIPYSFPKKPIVFTLYRWPMSKAISIMSL